MGGIGRQNPIPFQIGGGTSELQRTWFEMRKHLGEGGPGPLESLEDRWRFAKACGLVKVTTMGRRALMQFFPHQATDHLTVYENLLRVPRATTDEGRRIAITAKFTAQVSAVIPEVRTALMAFDPNIDVVIQVENQSVHFHPGKMARPRDGTAGAYGVKAGSDFPAFSSHFILTVLWSGLGASPPPTDTLAAVQDYLNDVLPSWVDWRIVTNLGFFLDGFNDSRLDLTAFS
ncbi:MAG: hypothetical protein V3W41_22090 [Planctomycetota bacterium]